jgi:hypothetical protein
MSVPLPDGAKGIAKVTPSFSAGANVSLTALAFVHEETGDRFAINDAFCLVPNVRGAPIRLAHGLRRLSCTRVTREGGAVKIDEFVVLFGGGGLLRVTREALGTKSGASNLRVETLRFQLCHQFLCVGRDLVLLFFESEPTAEAGLNDFVGNTVAHAATFGRTIPFGHGFPSGQFSENQSIARSKVRTVGLRSPEAKSSSRFPCPSAKVETRFRPRWVRTAYSSATVMS